jgi:hypothetical protein
VLDLLIASSSKYVSIGTILPIGINLWTKNLDEYLLANFGDMGEKMFMMCCIGKHELMLGTNLNAIRAFNKFPVIL